MANFSYLSGERGKIFVFWVFSWFPKSCLLKLRSRMKSPNFENCQIELNEDGTIGKISEAFVSWVGQSREELKGMNFRAFFLSLERSWELLIPQDFHHADFECFLPLSSDSRQSSLGIFFNFVKYNKNGRLLAPNDVWKFKIALLMQNWRFAGYLKWLVETVLPLGE